MSESKLQTKVLKYMKKEGYWVFKTVVCNRNGIMDVIACSPGGRFVGIELKFGDNSATPLQLHNIKEVKARNGVAFTAYNMEDIYNGLRGIDG